MPEHVILVDENDNELGTMEKLEAHEKAVMHRAFSVFIFNEKGEMLLQQRSMSKYHSAGLWTNACCSHPRPGEDIEAAAIRRLKEELHISADIRKIFDFTYRSPYENGLTEHEFDHVFVGIYDEDINPNNDEVMDYKFVAIDDIKRDLQDNPSMYTSWFHLAFPKIEQWASELAEENREI